MVVAAGAVLAACSAGTDPTSGTEATGSSSGGGGAGAGQGGGAEGGAGSGTGGGPVVDCSNPLDLDGCTCPNVGEIRACYPAEPGTQNLGACTDGSQTCQASGEFANWGPCTGAVLPTDENCADTLDHNCNGLIGCADSVCVGLPGCCSANDTRPCYDGPSGTDGVGVCHGGTQICDLNGAWLACMGQVLPGSEGSACSDQKDNDCDGKIDCNDFNCIFSLSCQQPQCTAGATQPCYDGPSGTSGVGPCHGGTQTCSANGDSWGPCVGQVTPQSESAMCADSVDNDCDSTVDCADLNCASAAACCTTGGGTIDGTIWANSPSTLYRIDPTTFAVTTIGTFDHGDQMTDLAVTPSGDLYGVSFSSLYSVNKVTAQATFVADVPGIGNNALTFLPNGNLLAADSGGDVKIINPSNGTVTSVGNYGNGLGSSGDLIAVASGATYGTTPGDDLVTINTQTGVAAVVGPIGHDEVWGLAYANAKVIGLTTAGTILQIDPLTGTATVLASTGLDFWGGGQSPLVVDNDCP